MTDQELKDLVAENSRAIKELRESQRETSEQMKKTDEYLENVGKKIDSLRESQIKTDEQMKKTDDRLNYLSLLHAETDEQMKKTDEQMKKTDDKLNKLAKLYGDSENNKGIEVEEYFYRYFRKHKYLGKIKFDEVDRNIISADGQEHDIVLINGKASALISVKYKLKKKDIDDMIDREIGRVKYFFTRLGSTHKLYAGIASFVVTEEMEKYAKSKGLYVFSRKGDDVLALNDKDFVGTEF